MIMDDDFQEAVAALVREAMAEDERDGGEFDRHDFAEFFAGHDRKQVNVAWQVYESIHNGRALRIVEEQLRKLRPG